MKYLISIIKFFNKRELEALYRECRNMSNICSLTAANSHSAHDADFFLGKAEAYKDMADFIEKRVKEAKNE